MRYSRADRQWALILNGKVVATEISSQAAAGAWVALAKNPEDFEGNQLAPWVDENAILTQWTVLATLTAEEIVRFTTLYEECKNLSRR
jgi:hypothetical protein